MKIIKQYWWILTGQKRFRVKYYEDGRYSKLMTYFKACDYISIFGGQVCVDYNKILKP